MRLLKPLIVLLLIGLGSTAAFADSYKIGNIEVMHPWARAQLKGTTVADGFVQIVNHGSTDDTLLSVSVDFATAQIHNMTMNGNMMQMEEMKDGVPIPAGGSVTFQPNAMHIMFVNMNRQLQPNQMVDGELNFAKAGKLKVQFIVEPAGATQSMDMN